MSFGLLVAVWTPYDHVHMMSTRQVTPVADPWATRHLVMWARAQYS